MDWVREKRSEGWMESGGLDGGGQGDWTGLDGGGEGVGWKGSGGWTKGVCGIGEGVMDWMEGVWGIGEGVMDYGQRGSGVGGWATRHRGGRGGSGLGD